MDAVAAGGVIKQDSYIARNQEVQDRWGASNIKTEMEALSNQALHVL